MTIKEISQAAAESEPAPGIRRDRLRAAGRGVVNLLRREATLVVLAGFAISIGFNWPIVRHPRSVVVSDLGDPLLQAWELAWQGHFLTHGGSLWTTNVFYPAVDGLAFSDSLLGYLPLGLFGNGIYAAIFRYNAAYVFASALAFIGCYLLARQLGSNWPGAALAGVVFAWSPWRLAHSSHLNILSAGGIALALYALAKGHGYSFRYGCRPELARPWWVFFGWVIAAWQITIGFAVGIPFLYVLGGIGVAIVVVNVRRHRELGNRVAIANAVGMPVFLGVTLLMAIPYLRVVDRYHFNRTWREVALLSPPPRGLLTAADFSWLWRDTLLNGSENLPADSAPAEMMLFPGFLVILLALAGFVVSAWSWRVRIGLTVAIAVSAVLALGATFFGGRYTYYVLWRYLPGWDALRTPGRLILWASLALALLAAGAITGLARAWAERDRRGRLGRRFAAAALTLPAIGALLEGVPDRPYVGVPGLPAELRQVFEQAHGPIVVLPVDVWSEFRYMLWSTDGFPVIANGNSGYFPSSYFEIIAAARTFPEPYSVEVMKKYGIQQVVVLKDDVASTPYAGALRRPVAGLPVTKEDNPHTLVFTLR